MSVYNIDVFLWYLPELKKSRALRNKNKAKQKDSNSDRQFHSCISNPMQLFLKGITPPPFIILQNVDGTVNSKTSSHMKNTCQKS